MAALPESPVWESEIYQLEDTDPVSGGAPNLLIGDGMDNVPHQQLARRTSWLKAQVDTLLAAVVEATTSVAGIVRLSSSVTSTSETLAATPAAVKAAYDAAQARVPTSRLVAAAGLATGGGSLLADRTIDVPVASQAEAEAGTLNTKAMTPLRVAQSIAAALAATWTASLTILGEYTGARLRLLAMSDASAVSTLHAFQIGVDSGVNLRMDANEIMALDNGAYSVLNIQNEGGDVTMGSGSSTIDIPGKISWHYESAEQTITGNSILSLSHGLGTKPTYVEVVARCITAQGAFSAGDELRLDGFVAGGVSYGFTFAASAVHIRIRIADAARLVIFDNIGGYATMTLANWRIVARARK
jgi:hypothetical protein